MDFQNAKYPFPHICFKQIDSTNKYLLDNLSKISPLHGFMAISDFQTEGRGQYGRTWESESGKNILCSIALDCSFLPLDKIFGLHLIASLSVRDLISKYSSNVSIKWPNDIYIKDRKVAGILVENTMRKNALQWTVIGTGINVFQDQFSKNLQACCMQKNTNSILELDYLVFELHQQILSNYEKLLMGQFKRLLEEYNECLFRRFQRVNLLDKSSETVTGIVQGVDGEGKMLLQVGDSVFRLNYGDYTWKLI
ncbi:MAG: biotin--[acetyl-CoA-carboxylase] ligase [Saprospiraceae bacterium]|nr:biotin--[acetyl-CoA-carboxylase] ligase [Saprospiraceae bacterium]